MEDISYISQSVTLPWKIKVKPYLYDHQVDGRAVFPAVETLIELARAVRIHFPQAKIGEMTEVSFPRFLVIPEKTEILEALIKMYAGGEDEIETGLFTKMTAKAGDIRRTVEHARLKFTDTRRNESTAYPFCNYRKLEGECINIPAEAIYRELVPFGKSYRNITGDLSISDSGALAFLSGGTAEVDDDLLGSPFPCDAVLHAACVWAQRFAGVVPFPTGWTMRTIYRKTVRQNTYLGRVAPVSSAAQALIFNAWIFDMQGFLCEEITGIRMRDVSRGAKKPPDWVRQV